MTWDATTPADSEAIRLGAQRIREFKTDLATAFTTEHSFPGTDTANPKLIYTPGYGNTAARPAASVVGRLYFNSQTLTVQRDTGAAWVDIAPLIGYQLITTQTFLSGSGTYTTPAGVKQLRIRLIGGGGGGAGSGALGGDGGTGGDSAFNSIVATGGGGGKGLPSSLLGGVGGTGGSGSASLRIDGGAGQGASTTVVLTPSGGSSHFGGAGVWPGGSSGPGGAAKANTGGGGSGALNTSTQSGAGGGAGEYVEIVINAPSSTYSYAVGAGGAAGTGTAVGGVGGSGVIIVEEFY